VVGGIYSVSEITRSEGPEDVSLDIFMTGFCKGQKQPEVLNVTCRQ
jgi:hypothetical protein